MASPDKIVHPQYPLVKLAAAVDPAAIRDIQDSIIPTGYGKWNISCLDNNTGH